MIEQVKRSTFKHSVGVNMDTLTYLKTIKKECSIAEKLREIIEFYKKNKK
jgi:hypothetical protein